MGIRRSLVIAALSVIITLAGISSAAAESRAQTFSLVGNGCRTLSTDNMGTGVWQVSGTFVATVTWYVSANGSNFLPIDAFTADNPGTAINSTTAPGGWSATVAAWKQMQACVTGYMSGTVDIYLSAVDTGGGGGGGGGTITGDVMVGAQPANDPHYVRCSDGSIASACLVGDGTGPLTVDGTVVIGSGTLTAVTGITNPVTVTDGSGAFDVTVTAGTITAVTSITNTVTIAGAVTNGGTFVVQENGTALTRLTSITDQTDGLEASVDGLETLLGTGNTSLGLIDDTVFTEGGTFTAASSKGILGLCAYQVTPVTIADEKIGAVHCDNTGAVKVSGSFALDLLDSGDDDITVDAADALGVVLKDGAGNIIEYIDIVEDEDAFTYTTTPVTPISFVAESTTDAIADGLAGAPLMTTNRQVRVANSADDASAIATSGCYVLTTASTNSTSCKGSAGNLYGMRVLNTTATVYYLRMYNSASAPTCSSATGFIESVPVPASTTGAGFVWTPTFPLAYTTGIGYCVTASSTSTANDNAAAGIFGVIQYK